MRECLGFQCGTSRFRSFAVMPSRRSARATFLFSPACLSEKSSRLPKDAVGGISRQATVVAPCHTGIGGEGGIDSGHPWPSPYGRLLRRRLPGLSCPVIEPMCFAQRPSSDRPLYQVQKSPAGWGFFVPGGEGGIRTHGTGKPYT